MNQKGLAVRVWNLIYPLLFYYAVLLTSMSAAQIIVGADHAHFVICQLASTLVTIPFILPFYRQTQAAVSVYDQARRGREASGGHASAGIGWSIMITGLVSVSLNNLISMSPLVGISAGYREANAGFYGSTLPLELISSGLATPVLEELVFRGIFFVRLKAEVKRPFAVLLSALVFAAMHFNIVQFVYALAVGALLAVLMDKAGHVCAAVAGHITANVIAVLRTETGILAWSTDGSARAWMVSVLLLLAGGCLLVWYLHAKKSGASD